MKKAWVITGSESRTLQSYAMGLLGAYIENIPVITYAELVTKEFSISYLVLTSPKVVLVADTPWTGYSLDFIKMLVKSEKLPCDVPHRPFSLKPSPMFVFLVPTTKEISTDDPLIEVYKVN